MKWNCQYWKRTYYLIAFFILHVFHTIKTVDAVDSTLELCDGSRKSFTLSITLTCLLRDHPQEQPLTPAEY